MSDELFQKCSLCNPNPGQVAWPDPGRCPGCRGRGFVEVGLTTGQFELYARKAEERDALVRFGVWRDKPGDDARWFVGDIRVLSGGGFASRGEAARALLAAAKAGCLPAELEALAREERECDEFRAENAELRHEVADTRLELYRLKKGGASQ